ncbi:MAG TPA: AbrB/MazE/SpoVT family DNA-binding domain-containing protein, partial [Desulfocapsa sulfexigens]|nr:AbrB/MazE/SpoVT family DNA-binding domain-containing protein [Desulfocapsa sulfexigens]
FELEGYEAIIRKEGDKLIIEPVNAPGLLKLLTTWDPLQEDFPEIEDSPVTKEEIF